jgi:uncharacterized protein
MDKNEAIEKVKEYSKLLNLYFKYKNIYLFGSYVSGNYHKDSDIDVAIVVSKLEDDFFSVNPLLWKLRRQIDDRIEPILIDEKHDDANFLSEIKNNGIEIV